MNLGFGIWDLGFGIRISNLEFRIWNLEFGIWNNIRRVYDQMSDQRYLNMEANSLWPTQTVHR
jgi:hypothetical protein